MSLPFLTLPIAPRAAVAGNGTIIWAMRSGSPVQMSRDAGVTWTNLSLTYVSLAFMAVSMSSDARYIMMGVNSQASR